MMALAYAKAYRVNMEEAQVDGPFPSFDAFFTRKLRQGMRSISQDPVVSPADGLISAQGVVSSDSSILVKGQEYPVAELIGSPTEAKRYVGGRYCVVYLSPRDYHRVHSPVAGMLTSIRGMPGDLYPVNSIGERYVRGLFIRNNRATFNIETETHGAVALVMIGATIVGRIGASALGDESPKPGLTELTPPVKLERGDELGVFHLGSTVVLLVEPGVELSREPGAVKYGETILRAP